MSEEKLAEKKRAAEVERAARYGELYQMLGLKVVVRPDEGLEASWGGGVCKLEDLPTAIRRRTRDTTPS